MEKNVHPIGCFLVVLIGIIPISFIGAVLSSAFFGENLVGLALVSWVIPLVFAGLCAYALVFRPLRHNKQRASRLQREAAERERENARLAAIRLEEERRLAPIRAAEREAEERRARAQQMAAERARLLETAEANNKRALSDFVSLPQFLEHAQQERVVAERHMSAGAASPFWSSIESAYRDLASYEAALGRIEQLGKDHLRLSHEFNSLGGASTNFPTFPIEMDAAAASSAASRTTNLLGALTYRAHTLPRFDSIWEQRRTTAAVASGFGRLEDVINAMSSRLQAGQAALVASIEAVERAQISGSGRMVEAIRLSSEIAKATTDAIIDANDASALHGGPQLGATAMAAEQARQAANRLRELAGH